MGQTYHEKDLSFTFEDGWLIIRPQESDYYKIYFSRLGGGTTETDFVAYDPAGKTLWLIEVKDYRKGGLISAEELVAEIGKNARDTAALLFFSERRDQKPSFATKMTAGQMARSARPIERVRVALHCEFPDPKKKLAPPTLTASNVRGLMRRRLFALDKGAMVTSMDGPEKKAWTVAPVSRGP